MHLLTHALNKYLFRAMLYQVLCSILEIQHKNDTVVVAQEIKPSEAGRLVRG